MKLKGNIKYNGDFRKACDLPQKKEYLASIGYGNTATDARYFTQSFTFLPLEYYLLSLIFTC